MATGGFSSKRLARLRMAFHRDGISISPAQPPDDLIRTVTSGESIHAVRQALGAGPAA